MGACSQFIFTILGSSPARLFLYTTAQYFRGRSSAFLLHSLAVIDPTLHRFGCLSDKWCSYLELNFSFHFSDSTIITSCRCPHSTVQCFGSVKMLSAAKVAAISITLRLLGQRSYQKWRQFLARSTFRKCSDCMIITSCEYPQASVQR